MSKEAPVDEYLDDEEEAEDVSAADVKALIAFVLPFCKPYKGFFAILMLLVLTEAALNFSFPLVTQYLIDEGLIKKEWEALVRSIAFMGIAAITVSMVALVADYMYTRVFSSVVKDIRQHLFDHVQSMSMPFFHTTPTGTVLSRFSGDLVAVETGLVGIVPLFIMPFLEVIYATILMFMFDIWLGLIGALIFPLILWWPRIFARKAFNHAYEKRQTEGHLLGAVQENVAAQPVIKAFGMADRARHAFSLVNGTWFGIARRTNFASALVERTAQTGLYVVHIIVFALGSYWAFTDRITVGTIIAFEGVFLSMGYALTNVTQYVPTLAQAAGSIHHLNDMLQVKPTMVDPPDAKELQPFAREITFENVAFNYPGSSFRTEGLSVTVPKGSFLGIVGPSGSGKSTFLNLLMRFYDPGEGRVAIDGVDIRSVSQASLREQMAVVFQESFLFNTTIAENIRMAYPQATMEEIHDAARQAEVHDFIMELPEGYDTMVGERGGQLSGGQRQRVAIARALVRNPAVLVLDEATSALDAATEHKLNETLSKIAETRTVVSVTHRLGSVVTADRIIVLDHGHIVETGTHSALVAQGGLYANMWSRQRQSRRPEAEAEADEDE
ncbi:ABC transporter ATP-binding protein [Phreatobacter aquaticus]|uniref:ABC transporter ATP-binding protein n=1 Tax=Phreatobacter aquaticus TaxID=2570229 RepID=A0A4D7QJC7_9HYPH|nr:ABC transporter ATP-binding protein [Phreatobacter aquaticus]QCK85436.1 ABC transporter ATP-binding protein [Phreatobacter aquaticus]